MSAHNAGSLRPFEEAETSRSSIGQLETTHACPMRGDGQSRASDMPESVWSGQDLDRSEPKHSTSWCGDVKGIFAAFLWGLSSPNMAMDLLTKQ